MASAQERFKLQNAKKTAKNVDADVQTKAPTIEINDTKAGDLAVSNTVDAELVDDSQVVATDSNIQNIQATQAAAIAHTNAITSNMQVVYQGANSAIDKATEATTALFDKVSSTLAIVLAHDATVDSLKTALGSKTTEERNAELAVLDEIDNALDVSIRANEIKDKALTSELAKMATQLKYCKGMMRNALTVEEIKDLENQLVTKQEENRLKQDGRNINLMLIQGTNAVNANRVTERLDFLQKKSQKIKGNENDYLDHMDQITLIQRRVQKAIQTGFSAFAERKELAAKNKKSLVDKLKGESNNA